MSDDGEIPEDPQRPPQSPERFERAQGRRLGDTHMRVVRPRGFRRGRGVIVATEASLESSSPAGRVASKAREILFGKRIPTEREDEERLGPVTGLAIFASDNISSSAYATEETMRALALAGAAGLALTMPITIAIIVILAIVVTSYLQVIRAYPNGGGSYIVASHNLGVLPGLLAAAALLVDYVLTVSVSVAAVLVIGFYRVLTGDMPTAVPPPKAVEATEALSAFLILRAFSSGSVGLSARKPSRTGSPPSRSPRPATRRSCSSRWARCSAR